MVVINVTHSNGREYIEMVIPVVFKFEVDITLFLSAVDFSSERT